MEEPTNGNRATVALVYEAVNGLKQLTRAEFTAVQRQLDALADVPERVARLEARVADLDNAKQSLPTIGIAFVSLVVAIATLLVVLL